MLRFPFLSIGLAIASCLFALSASPLGAQPANSTPAPPSLSASESNGSASPTSSPKQQRSMAVAHGADAPAPGDAGGVTITLDPPEAVTNYWNNTYVRISGQQTFGEDVHLYDGDGQNDENEYGGCSMHFATHAGVTRDDPQPRGISGLNGYQNCPRLPAPGKTYYFKAFGQNYGGAVVATSNEVSITMIDHPPTAVTLSAQVGDYWSGGQKVDLSWTQTTDSDSNYEGDYTLCEADHPGVTLDDNVLVSRLPSYGYYGWPAPGRTHQHYASGDPTPGKKHYYRLFVRDANNIVASNEVEVSVLQKAPDIEISGTPRACAGGTFDYVHLFSLQIDAKREGYGAFNEQLELSFEGNVGNPNKARFVFYDEEYNLVTAETQTLTTDWSGSGYILVMSSDTVSAPALSIKWKGQNPNTLKLNNTAVTNIKCDFGKAQGKRRYGILFCDQGADDDEGFDFDPGLFDGPGSVVPGTYVLKWQQDPAVTPDNKYFTIPAVNPSDPPVPVASIDNLNPTEEDDSEYLPGAQVRQYLNDAGNWWAVPNHKVEIKITEIVPHENTTLSSSNPTDYAFFVDAQGYVLNGDGERALNSNGQAFTNPSTAPEFQLPTSVMLQSDSVGKVRFFLCAAQFIDEAATVGVNATDKTQHDAAPVAP